MKKQWLAMGFVIASLSVGACTAVDRGGGGGTTKRPPAVGGKVLPVKVTLTAASLADDCSTAEVAQDKSAKKPSGDVPMEPESAGAVAGDCAGEGCGFRSFCQQTSMQLSFVAGDGTASAQVQIVSVKLYDGKTRALIGTLNPRNPRVWSEKDGNYAVWNQSIAPAQTISVSYDLSAPDWSKVDGGRWGAHDKTFRMEAVVKVGNEQKTVEVTATSPELMIEPPVVT